MERKNMDFYEERRNNYSIYRDIPSKLVYSKAEKEPQISIVIPTYNRMEYLLKALISVKKQCTEINYEVVIVDNNPNTDIYDIRKCINVDFSNFKYYINEKNIGMFGNWNRCIELAETNWVTILNDDDELCQDYINTIFYQMKKCKGGAVICDFHYIDENGDKIFSPSVLGRLFNSLKNNKSIEISIKDFYYRYPIKIYGAVFRRDCLLEIGGFDERFFPCSDEVLLFNLCSEYGLLKCEKKIFKYRWAINESQKLDTRINFVKFVNSFQRYINSHKRVSNERFDSWFRNAVADNTIVNLERECELHFDNYFLIKTKADMGLYGACKTHKLCDFFMKLYRIWTIIFRL